MAGEPKHTIGTGLAIPCESIINVGAYNHSP